MSMMRFFSVLKPGSDWKWAYDEFTVMWEIPQWWSDVATHTAMKFWSSCQLAEMRHCSNKSCASEHSVAFCDAALPFFWGKSDSRRSDADLDFGGFYLHWNVQRTLGIETLTETQLQPRRVPSSLLTHLASEVSHRSNMSSSEVSYPTPWNHISQKLSFCLSGWQDRWEKQPCVNIETWGLEPFTKGCGSHPALLSL